MNPDVIYSFTAESANYTAKPGDTVLVTTGTSVIDVTLPESYTSGPTSVIVRKVDAGTGYVAVKTSDGTTVDGVAGTTGVTLAATQYTGAHFALNTDVTPNAWWRISD